MTLLHISKWPEQTSHVPRDRPEGLQCSSCHPDKQAEAALKHQMSIQKNVLLKLLIKEVNCMTNPTNSITAYLLSNCTNKKYLHAVLLHSLGCL